jgi:hypothetical protein
MKPFRMLKIPVILLGFAGALILSPACKAQQEVSPDHFTDTGVEHIYQAAPHKAAAHELKQTPPVLQARHHRTDSPATPQLTATRHSLSAAQPSALAIPEKRKTATRKPNKPESDR